MSKRAKWGGIKTVTYEEAQKEFTVEYRCPNGPPGTDPARTRFVPVRIGPGQARPVDASGRVGLAHVPRDMPKPGTHREKSCWAGHWPEPTVKRGASSSNQIMLTKDSRIYQTQNG